MRESSSAGPNALPFSRAARTRSSRAKRCRRLRRTRRSGRLEQLLSGWRSGQGFDGAWGSAVSDPIDLDPGFAKFRTDHEHAQARLARRRCAWTIAARRGHPRRIRHRRQRRGAGRNAVGSRAGLRRLRLHHGRHRRRRRPDRRTASRRAASPIASSATSASRGFPAMTLPAPARSMAIASKASRQVRR